MKINGIDLDHEIKKRINDPKVHSSVMWIINELKKEKKKDIEILAIGILITNMAKDVIEKNGQKGNK